MSCARLDEIRTAARRARAAHPAADREARGGRRRAARRGAAARAALHRARPSTRSIRGRGTWRFPAAASIPATRRRARRRARDARGGRARPRGAELLGRLDDVEGAPPGFDSLVVSAFVYASMARRRRRRTHEVRDALWVPLAYLSTQRRRVPFYWPREQRETHYPGILVGEPDATSCGA
jgi:hypothetical protein